MSFRRAPWPPWACPAAIRPMLAGAVALLACVQALAQAPSERLALVIGNQSYRQQPLENPRADAEAMGELLRKAGFDTVLKVDESRQSLLASVAEFGERIRDPKVRLVVFYYAGHAVQLGWRNFIIPIDAKVTSAEDIPRQTIEVSELFRYMRSERGRSFLIILDACRDDPFGGDYRLDSRGLAQSRAPVGSLLAYATEPGGVARDGKVGGNGLYTGHLLRELQVPGVRIEDAFKRVRLSVRLASNNRQRPWESTSLEEDVYIFPTSGRKLTEAELEQLIEREEAAWSKVRTSVDQRAVAEFIREFPSGAKSELAQSRFNRLLANEAGRVAEDIVVATRAESQRLQRQSEEARRESQARELALAEQVRLREEAKRVEALALEQAADRARQAAAREEAARREALRLAAAAEQAAREARERETQRVAGAALEAARERARRLEQQRLEAEQLAAAQAERSRQDAARAEAARQRLDREEAERRRLAQAEAERLAAARTELARLERAREAAEAAERRATADKEAASAAAQPVALAATPYFDGYNEFRRSYRVGNRFEFRVKDNFTGSTRPMSLRVTQVDVDADRVEFNGGEYTSDLMGNIRRTLLGALETPRQFYPAELYVGKKWITQFRQQRSEGKRYTFRYELQVVGRERITVPAGTFDTYRIEARGYNMDLNAPLARTHWVANGVNADIAQEYKVTLEDGMVQLSERTELVSFTP